MDKHHILVVDDNHINRLFFESSLRKLNLTVSLAENGFQAIEMCQQHCFDLILMDIRMDELDGIQTATAIKAFEPYKKTPILAISAERFEFRKYEEFVSSLLKPISQDELKRVLTTYLPEKPFDDNYFDEELALQISHNDNHIVLKLRSLLIKQLPNDWLEIEHLYSNKDWSALDNSLHKLLGSAKICAASLMINHIKELKMRIKDQNNHELAFKQLNHTIKQTIQFAKKLS